MKRAVLILAVALAIPLSSAAQAPAQTDQQKEAARTTTRDRLRLLLDTAAKDKNVNVTFQQSPTQPYRFFASMNGRLKHADSLDIVITVTNNQTISFRVFPSFKGDYINVDKVRNAVGLMRKLVTLNEHNFLFWGADDIGDIFAGYTVTLESGFPADAILVVLTSIRNTDRFVGDLRPFIDGSAAP